ncbi:hypothetical protein [Candidatus Uabimicrobium amorphum]|uniref:Peptidase S74 domain-containing protein n=1 Tax=Uabimicrobium amorphum TaxID=2596890 RepID=A0A5S9IRK5_UABAM|nr:hypothetical protein [Candidatus Uabimicrobium amorphum]BBM86604.1 hypothetical protein UABAM_04990 [Candidatus Uabimicrobium amorphum]
MKYLWVCFFIIATLTAEGIVIANHQGMNDPLIEGFFINKGEKGGGGSSTSKALDGGWYIDDKAPWPHLFSYDKALSKREIAVLRNCSWKAKAVVRVVEKGKTAFAVDFVPYFFILEIERQQDKIAVKLLSKTSTPLLQTTVQKPNNYHTYELRVHVKSKQISLYIDSEKRAQTANFRDNNSKWYRARFGGCGGTYDGTAIFREFRVESTQVDMSDDGRVVIEESLSTNSIWTRGKDIYFHPDEAGRMNHGIGIYHAYKGREKKFAGVGINGPVVYGYWGGILGTTKGGQKIAIKWNDQQQVSVLGHLAVSKGTLHLNASAPKLSFGKNSEYAIDINSGRFRLMSPSKHTFIDMSGAGTDPKVQINSSLLVRNNVTVEGLVWTKGRDIQLHPDKAADHGIGIYHAYSGREKKFAGVGINGPVVYGWSGGALGSTENKQQKIALRWDSNGDVKVTGQLSAKKISGAEDLSIAKVNANIISLNGGGTIKRVFDNGYSLEISSTNLHVNNKGISTKGRDVYFDHDFTNKSHGIGLYRAAYNHNGISHAAKTFAGEQNIDGLVIYGAQGGALGSTGGGQKIALRWDSAQNVSVKGNLTTNQTLHANHVSTKSVNVTEKFDAKSLHIDKDGWIGMNTAPVKDFTLAVNGRIGIGVTKLADAATKLAVKGKITAEEVRIVKMDNWADFVFADDYKLLPIDQLEQSIKRNRHLPDIPSVREVKEQGIQLGEMQAKLLQKIEELTLYTIEQEKKIKKLGEEKSRVESSFLQHIQQLINEKTQMESKLLQRIEKLENAVLNK